jgi:hypothetical protein
MFEGKTCSHLRAFTSGVPYASRQLVWQRIANKFYLFLRGEIMKRLWNTITSHLAMICSALAAIVGLLGNWFVFWPGIVIFLLSVGSLILQYPRDAQRDASYVQSNKLCGSGRSFRSRWHST